MNKNQKYFLDKSIDYTGKVCVVTGATGSLGFHIAYFLLSKNAEVILVGRNEEKLSKTNEKLNEFFPNKVLKTFICDSSNLKNIEELQRFLKSYEEIHYLFNNAGCYHMPVKMIGDHDITYVTNFISVIKLTIELCKHFPNLTVVQTTSLSYKFTKLNFDDLEFINKKSKMKRYSNSKRLLTLASLEIQKSLQNSIILAHPGVSATGLFNASKGRFNKFFSSIIFPIMKLIFMKPEKAALSIALAPSFTYEKDSIIEPRGLFSVWGYPRKKVLSKRAFKAKEKDNILNIIHSFIDF